MVTAIVYRQLPDIPHRQYVKRIVAGQWVVWHREKCAALRMERSVAKAWADTLWMRSTGWGKTRGITELSGEYGTEEVLP